MAAASLPSFQRSRGGGDDGDLFWWTRKTSLPRGVELFPECSPF